MKTVQWYALLLLPACLAAQNTASASGAWSNCATWGSPAAIYRNTSDTKTVNSGVTVTADANWSTAAIVLGGSGAVAFNGGIFVDFVNDQGADVACDALSSALQSAGCASCGSYNAATANQYVRITQAEYNAIRSQLAGVTVAGSSDAQLNIAGGFRVANPGTRSIGASQTKAPANSYIVAFAVNLNTNGYSSGPTGYVKLKYNTTASAGTGYADYGFGNAGTYPAPENSKYYFLIKSPSQTTYSGGGSYLAYYMSTGGLYVDGGGLDSVSEALNDSNTLNAATADRSCFQVITTTVKQW